MAHKENLVCPKCGGNVWFNIDNTDVYYKCCYNDDCDYMLEINKEDFVHKFRCSKCGGLIGELEENDNLLGVRCKNCNELAIVLEKYDDDAKHYRDPIAIAQSQGLPTCPRCGSTSISTGARGVNHFWGFIGASKTVNRCAKCGHMWEPKG